MSLNVAAGATVTWKNLDGEPHTVTSDSGLFRSGGLDEKDAFTFKFDKAWHLPIPVFDPSQDDGHDRRQVTSSLPRSCAFRRGGRSGGEAPSSTPAPALPSSPRGRLHGPFRFKSFELNRRTQDSATYRRMIFVVAGAPGKRRAAHDSCFAFSKAFRRDVVTTIYFPE